jgi:hypothetical protein
MRIKKTHIGLAAALAFAMLVGGCIISGQFIVVIAGTNTIESTDPDVDPLFVDVTGEDIWQDHKDDIQSIVDVKFECEFVNNSGTDSAHGELWVSAEAIPIPVSAQDVRDNATQVFGGLAMGPGETKAVKFSESGAYIMNLDTVLDLLEGGQFWVYGIVPAADEPYSLTVQGLGDEDYCRFMITFAAGS